MEGIPEYIAKWLADPESFEDFTESNLSRWITDIKSLARQIFVNLFFKESLKHIAKVDITVRRIKINYFTYPRKYGYSPSGNCETSRLLLQGHWLRDKGFPVGRYVNVIALDGLLIIIPEKAGRVNDKYIGDIKRPPKRWRI